MEKSVKKELANVITGLVAQVEKEEMEKNGEKIAQFEKLFE